LVVAEPAGYAAGEERPERVAGSAHGGEEYAEGEDLRGDVAAGGVDELGEESEEEESGFGIEDVDDDTLRKDAGERNARRGGI